MLYLESKPHVNVSGMSVVIAVQFLKTYWSTHLVEPHLMQSVVFSSFLCWSKSLVENIPYSILFFKHLDLRFKT